MATRKTTGSAGAADKAAGAGRKAGANVRRTAGGADDASARADGASARSVRRSESGSVKASNDSAPEFQDHVGSLADAIRQKPLVAAGAALLVGVVLGRFVL